MAATGGPTILLVEDKQPVRSVLAEILASLEATVLEAEDGAHALEVARGYRRPIEVLLTDVVMPGMQGAELARRFRELFPATKIVFMSGYANEAVAEAISSHDGDAFLRKPFKLEELRSVLENVL